MKIKILIIELLASFLSGILAHGQDTFQNLDFESANLMTIPAGQFGGNVSISSALPDWSGSIGGTPVTEVVQNDYSTGEASIDIFGPAWSYVNPGILDGNYTAYLQSGGEPGNSDVTVNTSIAQTGTIPANAESLEFMAMYYGSSAPSVSFQGNNLSVVLLSSGQEANGQLYELCGANIAAYAGETGPLQFTAVFPSSFELDDISFSTSAVPEPSPLILASVGGGLFALCRRRAGARGFCGIV